MTFENCMNRENYANIQMKIKVNTCSENSLIPKYIKLVKYLINM